ncbi:MULTISPECIES: LacI family DNA-binding transcriptional regulator [unclassified Schaalia]|uniref:LacI family DNA-binding transcriptional regulator n=1 Tax=unclassified Schaalia TaxID=2691889 RepID=UPI001E38B89E|nr:MULTISPECIES: LacI family DNA-binding transcriptional regulator [unclassified Schaalia]MCD4549770.1 LacI family transcriptional regulator [Schaalia sp. lx-260]MCD4556786.1 LacI family transcriptional regulator [Schaalia sp. lx-100]
MAYSMGYELLPHPKTPTHMPHTPHKRPTIDDVARSAGVSKATVSRVLSGTYPVSSSTKKAVQDAIDTLNYTASIRARSLATGKSESIAIVISEPLDTFFADPTFALILRGITDAMAATPYMPILLPTATPAEQRKALRLITNQAVDAVIHLSPWADQEFLTPLLTHTIPVVLCGQDHIPHWSHRFSFVYSDDRRGAAQAATHLASRGSRNPVALLGAPKQPAAQERLQGYRQIFPHLDNSRIRWGGWSPENGAQAMRDILASGIPFDSVLAASDRIARGALSVLTAHGLTVPTDVKIIGYDDHPTASDDSPQLSTIAQPMHEQGAHAFALTQDMLNGHAPRSVLLPTHLHIRETT